MPEDAQVASEEYNPFKSGAPKGLLSEDCVDSSSRPVNASAGDCANKTQAKQSEDDARRDFRLLLRSMSANAACSKKSQGNQGILQGLPRPADIAPPGQVPSFRCSASKTNERRHRTMAFQTSKFRRNNVEDVFYAPDYSESGKRRHSIGAYLNGEAMGPKGVLKITSVPSEVPAMDPPVFFEGSLPRMRRAPADFSARPAQTVTTLLRQEPPSPKISTPTHTLMSTSRKKRNRRPSNKEMEDIVIIYSAKSTEGQLWCDYLSSCFDKMMSQRARQHYRVMPWTVEEILVDDEQSLKSRGMVSNAKLQVVVLCPKLLDSITRIVKEGYPLKSMIKSEKVLSMLLGVSVETLEKDTDATTISYQEWQKMEINEQNTTIVENFLSAAVSILSKKAVVKSATDKAGFSIVPKKIKMGQNRVIALLNEPVTSDDNITVSVDKTGDIIPITSFKKRNPYTLQFDVPDCCLEVSMLIWIKIDKNGMPLGSRQIKCESRLRELDQILRASDNPMEFMCQTLGFKTSDRDQLDTWMLSSFQKNIPPHFSLLSTPQINTKTTSPSMDEYPTLLHFAARYGLEKLCWQLLECPGGDVASDIRNVRHLTPADLAHSAGFTELSVVLRGFMQMNEFSNMYYYLKNISEDDPKSEENKDTPEITSPTPVPNNTDPFSDICLQNLEPKAEVPILRVALPPVKHYDQLYENDSVINKTCDDTIQKALENDYLIQPSNIKVELPKRPIIPNQYTGTPVNASHHPVFIYSPSEETKPFIPSESTHQKDKVSLSSFTTKSTHSNGQDELAEIINDFKNNVFTINEVEKLVMDWRNRNETTQSLKEKQEQLDRMRREYERLQKKMKEDLKRPTPFERIKKIFSKGKSKSSRKSGIAEQTPLTSALRPNSRLSVQSESSSSSGRLSTVSGASIGENTLQPESDDKKASLFQVAEKPVLIPEAMKSDLNDDYLIPPPPRPLGFEVCMLDFHQPIENKPESQSGNDMPAQVYCHQFSETQSSEENMNKTAHLYMNISPQQ